MFASAVLELLLLSASYIFITCVAIWRTITTLGHLIDSLIMTEAFSFFSLNQRNSGLTEDWTSIYHMFVILFFGW